MATCPNGHESTWDDYCSECGDAMAPTSESAGTTGGDQAPPDAAASAGSTTEDAGAAPASPSPGGQACPNCADPYEPSDVFCETCGYDFATGSLPGAEAPGTGAATANGSPSAAGSSVVAIVTTDRDYFATAVDGSQLAFPDPVPEEVRVPLTGSKVLIGRHSQSRGIYPEIDLAAITEDPAVSGRHAMLHRSDEGQWTISDLGSTNGTTVAEQSLSAGVEVTLDFGVPIYLGAWTKISLENS